MCGGGGFVNERAPANAAPGSPRRRQWLSRCRLGCSEALHCCSTGTAHGEQVASRVSYSWSRDQLQAVAHTGGHLLIKRRSYGMPKIMPLRASGPTVRGPTPGLAANVFFAFWCAYLYSTRQAGTRCPSAFRLADLWILGLHIRSSCHDPGGFAPVTSSFMSR